MYFQAKSKGSQNNKSIKCINNLEKRCFVNWPILNSTYVKFVVAGDIFVNQIIIIHLFFYLLLLHGLNP